MCAREGTCAMVCMLRSEDNPTAGPFLPPWGPRVELGSSGLAVSTFTCFAILAVLGF